MDMLWVSHSSLDIEPVTIPPAGAAITVSFGCRTDLPKILVRYNFEGSYELSSASGHNERSFAVPSRLATYTAEFELRRKPGTVAHRVAGRLQVAVRGVTAEGRVAGRRVVERRVSLLAGAVASYRLQKGLSQRELAEVVDLSGSTISRVERGLSPSKETLDRLNLQVKSSERRRSLRLGGAGEPEGDRPGKPRDLERAAPPRPVFLGASAPPAARPGSELTARFAAYIGKEKAAVDRLLRGLSPRSRRHLDLRQCRWKPGTIVKVSLRAGSLEVEEPEQIFEWSGRSNIVAYDVFVPEDTPEGTVVLKYDVVIADVRVARLRLDLEINARGPTRSRGRRVEAEPAKTAFASYASEDRPRVLDRVSALEIHAGIDVFQDCLSLHPGERWKPRLEKEILERDLFLLFWSRHARRSSWVEWEWRTFLDVGKEEALELHPLDPVKAAPPPEELAHLHFADPKMTIRAYEAEESDGSR